MATQLVPVMRVKVDPNPRGSATSHVTMPAANPFEREELSVRSANQPGGSMPGMGEFNFDFSTGTTTGAESLPAAKAAPEAQSWWGGLLQNVASSAVKVGQGWATHELTKPDDKSIQTDPTQVLMAAAMANMNKPTANQLPAVNPNVMYPPQPAGMGSTTKTMMIVGGVAAVGIIGFMMMNKKGGGGGRRRRRR